MYSCSHCGAYIDDPDVLECPECAAYFAPGELMFGEDEDEIGSEDRE